MQRVADRTWLCLTGCDGRAVRHSRSDAVRLTRSNAPEYRVQDDQALRRQRAVRSAYEEAAQVLEQSGAAADRALARDVRDFVEGMPMPLSRAAAMAVEIGRRDRAVVKDGGEGGTVTGPRRRHRDFPMYRLRAKALIAIDDGRCADEPLSRAVRVIMSMIELARAGSEGHGRAKASG